MNKYVLKFRKEGYIKYISHLDLVRVFHKCFKMCDIELDYSKGFNPHPKMSFVQPLSLGYSSSAELLEFELINNLDPNEIIKNLNKKLPKGISIINCAYYYENKPLAGDVNMCEYKIYLPCNINDSTFDELVNSYLRQNEIFAKKKIKKSNEYKEINIRSMIRSISTFRAGDFIVMDAVLDGGSQSNLNPDLVVESFLKYSKLKVDKYDVEIQRVNIGFTNNFQI